MPRGLSLVGPNLPLPAAAHGSLSCPFPVQEAPSLILSGHSTGLARLLCAASWPPGCLDLPSAGWQVPRASGERMRTRSRSLGGTVEEAVPTVDIMESSVISIWKRTVQRAEKQQIELGEVGKRRERSKRWDQEPRAGDQEESREEPRQHVAKRAGFLRKLG